MRTAVLGDLMHDFGESDPDAMRNPLLADRVRYFKRTPKGVAQMCEVFDEVRREGIEQGIEQGIERELLDNVRTVMSKLAMTAEQALDLLDVPATDVARYAAML